MITLLSSVLVETHLYTIWELLYTKSRGLQLFWWNWCCTMYSLITAWEGFIVNSRNTRLFSRFHIKSTISERKINDPFFFNFFFFNSNFIYFTTITKQVHSTYINHARWHHCLCLCGLCVCFCLVLSVHRIKCKYCICINSGSMEQPHVWDPELQLPKSDQHLFRPQQQHWWHPSASASLQWCHWLSDLHVHSPCSGRWW